MDLIPCILEKGELYAHDDQYGELGEDPLDKDILTG